VGYEISISLMESISSTPLTLDVENVLTQTIQDLEDTDDHWFCVKAYSGNGTKSICSNVVKSPKTEVPEDVLPILDFKINVGILQLVSL